MPDYITIDDNNRINEHTQISSKDKRKLYPTGMALATLKKIETLLNNPTLRLARKDLMEAAKKIQDAYLLKTTNISGIRRFFGGIRKKENEIIKIYNRITKIPPPAFQKIDTNVEIHILSFLPSEATKIFGTVSKGAQKLAKQSEILKARQGIKDKSLDIKPLWALIEYGYIPRELIKYKSTATIWQRTFYRKDNINWPETLKLFRTYKETQDGKWMLNRAFENFSQSDVIQKDDGVLKFLLEEEVNPTMGKVNLFSLAICYGSIELVKYFLNKGMGINSRIPFNTPLTLAILHRQRKIVEFLLQHPDIDPNLLCSHGQTPLMLATRYMPSIISLLRQHPKIKQ